MGFITYYENKLEFLTEEFNFEKIKEFRTDKYGNELAFCVLKYRNDFREIEFVIDNAKKYPNADKWVIEMYLKNIENEYPQYNDNLKCISSDYINLYTKTTERLYEKQYRAIDFSNVQRITEKIEIIKDSKAQLTSNLWFSKELLDKAYSEHMNYKAEIGWKESKVIEVIKKELQELMYNNHFKTIYDENKVNDYENDGLYPKLVYENNNIGFIISVDNRDGYLSVSTYLKKEYQFNKDWNLTNKKKWLKPEYIQDFKIMKDIINEEIKNYR